ncbi:NAD-dependent epimerase/dehydratase family protein [Tenacibaculum sp. M341]|uniref:NAD-dependent epimerase/dehydratase family protein n=1 Tax=Tenacibaculum sp. M341 TaxID=2530339 RepID=UPI001050A7D9|nr:NAD-dependent epimerase/dehydratase family protein [Tenacibaculum sp. M341]TCI92309.1 NAD-dependent epimerase/dehydratase family protein [Tenacibaculum sp. M341]
MILVTGGTGLVGSHLLYELTQNNDNIIAIYRTEKKLQSVEKVFSYYTENIDSLFGKIKWIKADITDIPSLKPVFSNPITQVYHCAALVSFKPKDYYLMREVNINGTANIVNFSIDANVQKLCFVSSIAAVGDPINNEVITEKKEWVHDNNKSGYSITKHGAEMEVWRGSQEGLDVVIVNPGVILGSGFFNEGSGKLFSQINSGLKFYTEGMTGFVGVKDVVKAMIQLTASEIKNERFILVSENASFKDVFHKISDALNVKKPSIKIGKFATAIFWRVDWLVCKITGKDPILTKNSARSSHIKDVYSSEKIKDSIQFSFEKIADVINDVSADFKKS